MSRLYVWLESDMSQQVTRRANEKLKIQVNYGSRDDSKPLVTLEVHYPHMQLKDDESEPNIIVTKGKGVVISAS